MNRSSARILPSFAKPARSAAGHVRARAADVALFLAADAHHHRRVRLLREQRRNGHRHGAAALAAESAAGVFANQDDVFRLDADPSRHAVNGADDALRGAVQMQLAVLPERHRAARLQRMMAGGRHDERLVEDQRRVLESRIEIAEGPFLGGLAHRHLAVRGSSEVRLGPLQFLDRRARRLARGRRPRRCRRCGHWARPGAGSRSDR